MSRKFGSVSRGIRITAKGREILAALDAGTYKALKTQSGKAAAAWRKAKRVGQLG